MFVPGMFPKTDVLALIKKTVTFKLVDKHLESLYFIDINPSEFDNSETNSFRNFGDLVYYNV